jgi:hypothetical protein
VCVNPEGVPQLNDGKLLFSHTYTSTITETNTNECSFTKLLNNVSASLIVNARYLLNLIQTYNRKMVPIFAEDDKIAYEMATDTCEKVVNEIENLGEFY